MSFFQAIFMAVLQGVTELFPVSSLGHAVVFPAVFLWPIDPRGPGFLPFLVILHLGTAAALLAFFWRDWIGLLLAVLGMGEPAKHPAMRRLVLMLIVGTIPAAIMGYLFNSFFRQQFGVPALAAMLLVVNGIVLWAGDRRHRLRTARDGEYSGKPLESLTLWDALFVGLAQCTALVPGISRSGVTIVTGLGRGLASDAAAHFSFLLAAPIIGGAAILEVPKLLHAVKEGTVAPNFLSYAIVGGIVAGISAYLSVAFLTRYFKVTEVKMMRPFALYCVVAGLASVAWFLLR